MESFDESITRRRAEIEQAKKDVQFHRDCADRLWAEICEISLEYGVQKDLVSSGHPWRQRTATKENMDRLKISIKQKEAELDEHNKKANKYQQKAQGLEDYVLRLLKNRATATISKA